MKCLRTLWLVYEEINELSKTPLISYSPQFTELVYKDDKTEMPISKLSAGYQSLLWMVMDLAYRVCMLNPELESREQITGIVLIDEIDLHLHPKWQWNVIDAFAKKNILQVFNLSLQPHSPIVISASKQANLILLDDSQDISYLPDCYGYEVEDVLRYRQESVSRPKKVKMLVDEIENAIDDIEFDKADAALERLKDVLGEDNSEYKKMAGCISDAKFIEEC